MSDSETSLDDNQPTSQAVTYFVNHCFLPPRLPSRDDHDAQHDLELLGMVQDALENFLEDAQPNQLSPIDSTISMVGNLKDSLDSHGAIDEENLVTMLQKFLPRGGTIPLYIRAQNAALIISNAGENCIFEAFELSVPSTVCLQAKGRVRRSFPALSIAVPNATFSKEGFRSQIALTLSKMSVLNLTEEPSQPSPSKAKSEKNFDSPSPAQITGLLMSVIKACGTCQDTTRIIKNTRDDVVGNERHRPWRRSPFWLMLRVMLQARLSSGEPANCELYKLFMVFFLSNILRSGTEKDLPSDILTCMNAKLTRRLVKLGDILNPWDRLIKQAMTDAQSVIETRWNAIVDSTKHNLALEGLRSLQIREDTRHSLPELDKFITPAASAGRGQASGSVELSDSLSSLEAQQLPDFTFSQNDKLTLELAAFEFWVEQHTRDWAAQHVADDKSWALLWKLVKLYHTAAELHYKGKPEANSVMILTLLDVFIALDTSACSTFSLLREYDTDIPVELLQSLTLPRRDQMQRLHSIEQYLEERKLEANLDLPLVGDKFGDPMSFPVRFYNSSVIHKQLLAKIEAEASSDRADKVGELKEKKERYRAIMKERNQGECDQVFIYSERREKASERQHDSKRCQRCLLKEKANGIFPMKLFEWPLPSEESKVKAMVFELNVPPRFQVWRDALHYIMSLMFECEYESELKKKPTFYASTYRGLKKYHAESPNVPLRIVVATVSKSLLGTETVGSGFDIGENDVCVQSPLDWEYYDQCAKRYTSPLRPLSGFYHLCQYELPTQSVALQRFLLRPHTLPNGPPPNEVISSQSECPDSMSLEEYRTYAALPSGYKSQWLNILVQISLPSMDFTRPETASFLLQVIYQAGPRDDGNITRCSHAIACTEEFGLKLLHKLQEALARVKQNWESSRAVLNYISLASRILSLTTSDDVAERCLQFLATARRVAFDWQVFLLQDARTCTDDAMRREQMSRAVDVSLICTMTFDIEQKQLSFLIGVVDEAAMLLRSSITIQQWVDTLITSADSMFHIAFLRWQRLLFRSHALIRREIIKGPNSSLDKAVKWIWADYQTGLWRAHVGNSENWLESRPSSRSNGQRLLVHYNLMTAELLVNGAPLARLPTSFELHTTYQALFGRTALEVVPSRIPGMEYVAKELWAGHRLHFGLRSRPEGGDANDKDLIIVAVSEQDEQFELLPRHLFRQSLPDYFASEFWHWYRRSDGAIIFCPLDRPWQSSEVDWYLAKNRTRSSWVLSNGSLKLINKAHHSANILSRIFCILEDPNYVTIIHHEELRYVKINLPRLQLSFRWELGTSLIQSIDHRGFVVDGSQYIGTFIGLENRLVLRDTDGRSKRLVLIPENTIRLQRFHHHVLVRIKRASSKIHIYTIDRGLGRLVDNGTLQSKLYLSYLHAVTSYCAPDPLTHRTGTEEALCGLNAASIRSFEFLDLDNLELLKRLSELSPSRNYPPRTACSVQTVSWCADLSFLSQHFQFYLIVESLFAQAREQSIFDPDHYKAPPALEGTNKVLIERDQIRCAAFRLHGYGAEAFRTDEDVQYVLRDGGLERAESCFVAASMILRRSQNLHMPISSNFHTDLWNWASQTAVLQGSDPEADTSYLTYDPIWLDNPLQLSSGNWHCIYDRLTNQSTKAEVFPVMMWLSTVAFSRHGTMDVIQTMAALYNATDTSDILPPNVSLHNLRQGKKFERAEISNLLMPSLVRFEDSPEYKEPMKKKEREIAWTTRRQRIFLNNQNTCIAGFIDEILCGWAREQLSIPGADRFSSYIDTDRAIASLSDYYKLKRRNQAFGIYLGVVKTSLEGLAIEPIETSTYERRDDANLPSIPLATRFYTEEAMFRVEAPDLNMEEPADPLTSGIVIPADSQHGSTPLLFDLLSTLDHQTAAKHESKYVASLRTSATSLEDPTILRGSGQMYQLDPACHNAQDLLMEYLAACNQYLEAVFITIKLALTPPQQFARSMAAQCRHLPRICPRFLIQQLHHRRWRLLPQSWKKCIITYGLALTYVQRAERLRSLAPDSAEFMEQLMNVGHKNWAPIDFPEALLLEVESQILIREEQLETALQMQHPPDNKNSISQLMMGLGKSSVVIPLVAAALSTGTVLTRVLSPRAQSRQMLHMLVSKLGGLLDRQIHQMPFSRSLKPTPQQMQIIRKRLQTIVEDGAVLLIQPEHLLSFQLLGLDCVISGQTDVGHALLETQHWLNSVTRDLVDESDEILSNVKFELIYTMGVQRPCEFSPERWTVIHSILELIPRFAPTVVSNLPSSIEVDERQPGRFPKLVFFRSEGMHLLLSLIAEHICSTGFSGFPIARQPVHVREAVLQYILKPELTQDEISRVENRDNDGFLTPSIQNYLLLLRGLIAGGILSFAITSKRYRVNYGLDPKRRPRTRLSVPYRGKDTPTAKSEFAHTDINITLTSLSYYYGGLSDEDLFLTFGRLLRTNQADVEYGEWVRTAPGLSESFRSLAGININDQRQCLNEVFPHLRFSKVVIDWYLSELAFPAGIREYPMKLSSSGWDVGREKSHPTTGFSGTNDLLHLLPLSVTHVDLPEQRHTNALVLHHILRPENTVELIPNNASRGSQSDADVLLGLVLRLEPPVRVIIDVGAFILEASTRQVAEQWLKMTAHQKDTEAVIFVDDENELTVIDRNGHVESLQSSPFCRQTHLCLVFLSEQHARGTDITLPSTYRAAVTLGTRLTKDRLCQACMRMRKLGKGQSIVFLAPNEIQTKIRERKNRVQLGQSTMLPIQPTLEVKDVLSWSIGESCTDLQNSMALWSWQGLRHEKQKRFWASAEHADGTFAMSKDTAEQFLEEEAKSMDHRFRPKSKNCDVFGAGLDDTNQNVRKILDRCREFDSLGLNSSTMDEESERERAAEIEQECQVEVPQPVEPAEHKLHHAVQVFVETGELDERSGAFLPAFDSLRTCSASFDTAQFSKDLLVTADFSTTIKDPPPNSIMDSYFRTVQYILTKTKNKRVQCLVIISPFEAHHLLEKVMEHKEVTLHVYAARPNLQYPAMDALDLITFGAKYKPSWLPRKLVVQLNLFAGQLCLGSYQEYKELCRYLCLAYYPAAPGMTIQPDGYVVQPPGSRGFQISPIPFIKVLMTRIRHDNAPIERTHMGKIIYGTILQPSDFESIAVKKEAVKEEEIKVETIKEELVNQWKVKEEDMEE